MSELGRATASLYEAFCRYPLKPKIESCPHCELDSAEASLRARPLQDLTWADLGVYPFKAMTTFGDASDFKHFLPRILELYVLDHEGAHYDVEVVLEKLNDASWTSWPETEKQAVRRFIGAWQRDLMASEHESTTEPWKLNELESALSESELNLG